MTASPSPIGRSLPRPQAQRHTEGRGQFTDDLVPPDACHLAFVRSPWAHARIRSIDHDAALGSPGVVAILTGRDLLPVCRPMETRLAALPAHHSAPQHPLAVDEACYQGEAVVAVVATSRAAAEEAAQIVEVDWQPLPEVATPAAALAADAPLVHSALSGNLALDHTFQTGDAAAALSSSDIVVEHRFVFARQTGVTLEPRTIVASFDRRSRELLVHVSHQVPFQVQDVLAHHLGLPAHSIRVVAPDVGGAFGLKLHAYADELAAAAIAVLLQRTIAFTSDRLEAFCSDAQAREAEAVARLGIDRQGRITALDVDILAGFGAYSLHPRGSVGEALQAAQLAGAPYVVPDFRARVRGAYQNKPPNGAYRGVGQPLAVAITEQMLDLAAHRLGMDPADIRTLNYRTCPTGEIKRTPAGLVLAGLTQNECLSLLRDRMDYRHLRDEQDRLRRLGTYRGIGLSSFLELTAVGSQLYGPQHVRVSAHEACRLSLLPTGQVRCDTSITDQGQGTSTGIAQIIAATLGIPIAHVLVATGDTHRTPYGGGAWASRGLALGGEAALQAATLLRAAILKIAAALLQAEPAALTLSGGYVVRADGQPALSLADLAAIAHFRGHEIPCDPLPPLEAAASFAPRDVPYFTANGSVAAHLEVDPHTGSIRLLDIWVAEDCGRIVNPLLVDEQIRGGVVQGIGAALFEECLYREDGQLLNGSLADYLVPMAAEMCDIHVSHLETPASQSILGARGVGEAGTVGAIGAIWTALNDALLPLGATVTRQPFTPEHVLDAIAAARPRA